MLFSIRRKEYEERIKRIRTKLKERELDVLYLSDPKNIFYVTGFPFLPVTRPVILLIPTDGNLTLIIPIMEKRRVKEKLPWLDDIFVYLEYPPIKNPINVIYRALKKRLYYNRKIGFDNTALGNVVGLRSTSVAKELPDVKFTSAKDIVEDMRITKSRSEIELIREAAKWGNVAQKLLQEYARPGVSEVWASSKATHEATVMMMKALGDQFETLSLDPFVAYGRFKAGVRTSYPHGLLANRKLRVGDVIETTAYSTVGNYANHMERTMFLGEPSKEQKRFFNLMVEAQTAAIDACKPGAKCCDVYDVAIEVLKDGGYKKPMEHRIGHGIGLSYCELPVILPSEKTVLQPGMVLNIEPALYFPGKFCFRHCDTIVVTKAGPEMIDTYPRDLESLTIPLSA